MEQFFSSENIALVSFALLVIGYLKFILYYKAFGIPIVDYIDPSEIITLFADNIATASVVIVALAIPYARLIDVAFLMRSADFLGRLQSYCSSLLPVILISAVFVFTMIFILWKRPKIYNFELVSYVVLWVIVLFVVPITTLELNRITEFSVSGRFIVAAGLIVSFGLLITLATFNEVRKVKEFGFYSKVVVKLSKIDLFSTDDEYFVGKTKSFVFFYSPVTKSATVYSSSDLVSISYS